MKIGTVMPTSEEVQVKLQEARAEILEIVKQLELPDDDEAAPPWLREVLVGLARDIPPSAHLHAVLPGGEPVALMGVDAAAQNAWWLARRCLLLGILIGQNDWRYI